MTDDMLENYQSGDFGMLSIDWTAIKNQFKVPFIENGITPGYYYCKKGRDILRIVQPKLYDIFKNKLSAYDKFALHKKAFKFYSNYIYKKFAIKDLIREGSIPREKINQLMKEADTYLLPLQLLILMNLDINHFDNACKTISQDEFLELLGMAYELNSIQLNSDSMSEDNNDICLEISKDYIYFFNMSHDYNKRVEKIYSRKIDYLDFYAYTKCITNEDKKEFVDAFFEDFGIDYYLLMKVLTLLSSEAFLSQFICIEPSYYCTDKISLINKIKDNLNCDGIDRTIEFLSLNCDKIRFAKGEMHDLIPLWERKTRTERIEIKPIIELNGIVFLCSPIFALCYNEWGSALTQLFLPFETGFNKTLKVLKRLRIKVQKDLVNEVFNIFNSRSDFLAEKEVALHKRFRNADFPEELGDYDVIAVNKNLKVIFLIECKCLELSKSVHEVYSKDKHFFHDNKYKEKFDRRIIYFMDNYHNILRLVFGIDDNSKYKIYPLMIFNKVIEPIGVDVDFNITSYHEFKNDFPKFIEALK